MKSTLKHICQTGFRAWGCIALGLLCAGGCHYHGKLANCRPPLAGHCISSSEFQEADLPQHSAVDDQRISQGQPSGLLAGRRYSWFHADARDLSHESDADLESVSESSVAIAKPVEPSAKIGIDSAPTPSTKSSRRTVLASAESVLSHNEPVVEDVASKDASRTGHVAASLGHDTSRSLRTLPQFDLSSLSDRSQPAQSTMALQSEQSPKQTDAAQIPTSPVVTSETAAIPDTHDNSTKQATSLPRASSSILTLSQGEPAREIEQPPQFSEPVEQPLQLELKTGSWPDNLKNDPVARAYQIYESNRSNAVFQDLDVIETRALASSNPNRKRVPGQLVGHRRVATDQASADSKLLVNESINPELIGRAGETGLTLLAKPQSKAVALSPLVTLSATTVIKPPFLDDFSHPSEETQPRFWPSVPDSLDILPNDEVGPIIDLPKITDDNRRLSVRPASPGVSETVER